MGVNHDRPLSLGVGESLSWIKYGSIWIYRELEAWSERAYEQLREPEGHLGEMCIAV